MGTRSKQEFESFSAHGINQGALRHRIQSKAIDDSTIKRVLTDFGPHDKLSDKQLASLDELVTKAHKLHVHRDDQGMTASPCVARAWCACAYPALPARRAHCRCRAHLPPSARGRPRQLRLPCTRRTRTRTCSHVDYATLLLCYIRSLAVSIASFPPRVR